MKVVITGGSGFLGQKVASSLLKENIFNIDKLLLVDIVKPKAPKGHEDDKRVETLSADLAVEGEASVIDGADITFHLAAVVSGDAEQNFDLGFKVNFEATRHLLERARRTNPKMKLVFSSTCAVFGGELPDVLNDMTAVQPENSYGIAKGMCELLINDYSRRGFVDGRIVRLPTVTVRPGTPNKAVTSFVSGIIREPLNGQLSECPCDVELKIWITSPKTVVKNIIHAAVLESKQLGPWKVVNLPGLSVKIKDMIEDLRSVAGEKVVSLIKYTKDERVSRMVGTFPQQFDNTRALKLGFSIDVNFADYIKDYIRDELNM